MRALVGELTTIMTKEQRICDLPGKKERENTAKKPHSRQKAVETKAMINSTLDVQDH